MKVMRFTSLLLVLVFSLSLAIGMSPRKAHAAFNANLLIDDVVFSDSGSMSGAQIDAFLNTFPNSCISPNSGFSSVIPAGYSPSGGFIYGDFTSAGNVIARAAQVYGINPQVLLATLQKEQSLVAGAAGYCDNGDENKYAAAAGYGCPDGGTVYSWSGIYLYERNGVVHSNTGSTCVNTAIKAGFSQQVIRAAWLLKFGQQRSLGNTGWAVVSGTWNNSDDPPTSYGGPMTQGNLSRTNGGSPVYYDGYITIDGSATHMDTGGTAALYWYTPHFHGNQLFVSTFESWFGGTISASYYSCHNSTNVAGAITGEHVIANKLGSKIDNLTLAVPNNTGSACIEVHTWLNGYQSWVQHTATNSPSFNPSGVKLLTLDGNGDGRDELYKVDYCGSSGMVEVHGWDASNQRWALHIATNRPCISSADAEVIAADADGNGRDELYLVQYRNTSSGRIEIHGWNANLQQWTSHTATNYGAVDPATAQVVAADTNGDGKDEFYLVNYAGNSGRIEVHGWSSDFQQWTSHTATASPSATHVDASNNPISDIITADTNGDGKDEFYKIDYHGTSSGMIEVHGLTPNLQQWSSHIATNQGAY